MRERPIFLRCPVTLRFAKTAFCNRGAEASGPVMAQAGSVLGRGLVGRWWPRGHRPVHTVGSGANILRANPDVRWPLSKRTLIDGIETSAWCQYATFVQDLAD